MPTVIGKTKAEFDRAEMAKRSGQKEDKTVHTMQKSYKEPYDIGEGLYLHRHGFDTNGNHSVWVSQGSERTKKIQTNQNLPTVHSTRPELTEKGMQEIHEYAKKYWKDDQHERAKSHPKYEKLKSALGKQGAMDAILKEMNEQQ